MLTRPFRILSVSIVIIGLAAAVSFLYGVPAGRRARHEMLRILRVARNAVGIYPEPTLTLRTWNQPGRAPLLVDVYERGQLVVSERGERTEHRLSLDEAAKIVGMGKAALGDFNRQGCGAMPGGPSAALYLLIDGEWTGSVCRDAAGWPHGAETKRLLAEIDRYIGTGAPR